MNEFYILLWFIPAIVLGAIWLKYYYWHVWRKDITWVYLRTGTSPVKYDYDRVRYDRWGVPYIKEDTFKQYPFSFNIVLRPNGRTDNRTHEVQWRHAKGPPVKFTTPDYYNTKEW